MTSTDPLAQDVYADSAAFAEMLAWSQDRPCWQRDGLRRLMVNGVLGKSDIEELVALCLDPSLPHEPLSGTHVGAQAAGREPVSLLGIDHPVGINALAKEQKLEFAPTGLTIIYGDNGSGKSGYVRILKHACRSRDRGIGILRDIEDAAGTPQSATIRYAKGAGTDAFPWTPALAAHPELPSVSIFDSRSANIHVEKTNDVAYIPEPMQIMEALASACDSVKGELERRLAGLAAKTPLAIKNAKVFSDTAAGAFVRNLSAKSNLAQLELLATLSDDERQRLASLEADLAQDPKRASARVTNVKERLEEAARILGRLADATTEGTFAERDRLRLDRDTKVTAAKAASEHLFSASPLPAIGEPAWRALWDAARRYSDEVAYPERKYPEPMTDAELCVLCQQALGKEALDRRAAFESFVKSTTKADEEAAREEHESFLARVTRSAVRVSVIRQAIALISVEVGDSKLATSVRRSAIQAAWRLRALRANRAAPGTSEAFPVAAASLAAGELAKRANQLSADATSAEHQTLVREFRNRKDRETLGPLKDDIAAEIVRLQEAATIEGAIKHTAKRPITNKNKELSDKLVTSALRGRFAREIEKLRLSRMPVELVKVKDQNAVSYFRVQLVEKPITPVAEIFSEGEHRCVALAAFLAELVTSKRYSGIVFDDPMSSLDHIHRKAVAARLVEEAAHRQVIVFTHDLAFLFELRREAEGKASVHYQTVSRRQNGPGYIEGELPTKATSALQLANALRSELKAAKSSFDTMAEVRRTIFCKGVIEQLREAWDQGIADFVYPVLGRFDNTIKGNSLYKLAVLTEQDVKTVTAARGRLSQDMHQSAEALNPETVSHATLKDEVGKLEDWLGDIARRQKDATRP